MMSFMTSLWCPVQCDIFKFILCWQKYIWIAIPHSNPQGLNEWYAIAEMIDDDLGRYHCVSSFRRQIQSSKRNRNLESILLNENIPILK